MITGERYGKLTYFRRLSNGTLTNGGKIQSDGIDIQTANNSWPFVCDYNADGKKDLLVGQEGIGAACNVYVYLNIGTNSAPVFTDSTPVLFSGRPLTYYRTVPVFIDIDVDGKKDMVLGGWYSDVRLYSNTGTNADPVFTSFVYLVRPDSQNFLNGNPPRVNFTDWDGDGDQDMLTCDYYGSVFLRRNITASNVADQTVEPPTQTRLSIMPNPVRGRTTIQLSGTIAPDAQLEIYDATGRQVKSFPLAIRYSLLSAAIVWDGRDKQGMALPSGVYIVMLTAGSEIQTERLVLVR